MSPMDGAGRYSAEAWDRTRQEALGDREPEAPPRQAGSSHSPSTLVPGVVEMSLRGDDKDALAVVASLRGAGFKAWVTDSNATRSGNRAGYRYFSVEVPRDDRG